MMGKPYQIQATISKGFLCLFFFERCHSGGGLDHSDACSPLDPQAGSPTQETSLMSGSIASIGEVVWLSASREGDGLGRLEEKLAGMGESSMPLKG